MDKFMIKSVVKTNVLQELFGDEPFISLNKKHNYKIDTQFREIFGCNKSSIRGRDKDNSKVDYYCKNHEQQEKLKYQEIEVPGESLKIKIPVGIELYRMVHEGFEYLLHIDKNTSLLTYLEKRLL